MPEILAAIWPCTSADGWQALTMQQRILAFRASVILAHQRAAVTWTVGALQAVKCVFVAPEYAFSDPDAGNLKPAEQTSTAEVANLVQAAKDLSETYNTLVVIPGTVAYREMVVKRQHRALNASLACYRGEVKARFEKRQGVGEVTPQDTIARVQLLFGGGLGAATFTVDGRTYGMEICADATGTGTLTGPVDFHVVVGQGVGEEAINNRATQYLLVAAPGTFGVYDRRQNGNTRLAQSAVVDSLNNTRVHFFRMAI